MKYGLPYKGSKNKLAERIVRLLPRRTNLVDLFCGGCAVSHAALLMGKFEHIYINDINWMCPTLFMDALQGKYANDTRWISREDFFRLRDTDPYVAMVWSFGNNMRNYLYSKEIEPLKKAIHYALFFSDYSLAKALGHDLSFVDAIKNVQQRYRAVRQYFSQFGHFQQQSFEGGGKISARLETMERQQTRSVFQKKKSTSDLGRCSTEKETTALHRLQSPNDLGKQSTESAPTALHRLQYQERLHSMPRVTWGGGNLPITPSALSYEQVFIPKDSVIYCDIPYKGTNIYNGVEDFDYERFYTWAESQTAPVFISSYQMPPARFDCIAEWSHRSTLNDKCNLPVMERIFVPKHQTERGNICQQLTLF